MRLFSSIRWKLTAAYLFTVLVAISALGLYLSRWTEEHYVSAIKTDLAAESRFVGTFSKRTPMETGPMDALAKQVGRDMSRRVTIIRADGLVLGDSHYDPASMEPHDRRPEVRKALESGFGWSIRYSETLRTRMLYVATRFGDPNKPLGTARLAESLSQVDRERRNIHRVFFLAALVAFIVAAVVGAKISSNIIGPILAMSSTARRFAEGDLSHRAHVRDTPGDEVDELARTLNSMAAELRRMVDESAEEKAKLETVFAKTNDGLIVVDDHARIRMLNPAASQLLGVPAEQIEGRTVIEGTLSRDLAELVDRVLRTGVPASLEVQMAAPRPTCLNVYVNPIERPDAPTEAVLVMHDVTAARHIDSVRRDFVANVSHELRTPLASIKAMAETIVLRGKKDPNAAADFAGKIMAEADRLTLLSEDLLDLAKIEAGRRDIRRETFSLAETAASVLSQFAPAAERKAIELSSDPFPEVLVYADRDAVYQVLANLVDNAIKYTRPGGKVTISAASSGSWVSVGVSDTGIGIPKEDTSRIFERFYRVDKARSRESGGTGLGLSIVKHLVESHGGRVSVQSSPEEGSTFTFTLPSPSREQERGNRE